MRARAVLAAIDRPWTRLATHCEVQALMRMRKEGHRHVVIALDRAPCGTDNDDPVRCDKTLDTIMRRLQLPDDATLTVVDPDEQAWTYPKENPS